MKVFAIITMSALSLVACERRKGEIIFHEDEAKQKTNEAANKAAEEAKKLGQDVSDAATRIGEKANEKAEEHKYDPAARGGGPTVAEECDAGVNCKDAE